MKVVKAVVGVALVVVGVATGNFMMALSGAQLVGSALLTPKRGGTAGETIRPASATTIQLGEVPRQAIFGRAATAGSLVDAFNYGGKYDTDWEVLVLDLADHRCEALEGFYVGETYVPFAGDGEVAGYNGQLCVWWRPGTENQTVPDVLLQHGPGWTPDDNGSGVSYAVVAYKADEAEAKEPVWPGGRPRFLWVLRGALCYSARQDGSVGGMGGHRWSDPTTRQWSENPIDCRYTWVRGLYACDRVGDPSQLMIGRGLSAIEAPPANVFHRANLCDETVDGAPRYRIGAIVDATATYLDVEQDFAAACAGTISQPQGSVEIDPGEARAAIVTITDDDLVVGSKVSWNNRMLSAASPEWVNTVVARYVEPAMKWADHAAPVRRDLADVLADRQPREERVGLSFVTDGAQAGRIAEIRRRMGRLPGRGTITLPPRFAFIEEGDWIVWYSPRRFGPLALTFRVDAWGSDAGWHHQLSLRQMSASVYSDTAPLDDGAVAIPQLPPPPIGAPAAGSWSAVADYQGGDMLTPVLVVTGAVDDPAARFIRIEYREEKDGVSGPWADGGVTGPEVRRREIVVAPSTAYSVAVSYVVNSVTGDRLILPPVTSGSLLYPDGTPISQLVDRGPYDDAATYERGNIVSLPDGSRWRYDAALPATGQRPVAGGGHWTMIQGPAAVIPPGTVIGGTLDPATGAIVGGVPAVDLKPALAALDEAIADLADVKSEATQLADTARKTMTEALAGQLLGEARKDRLLALTHLDGLPVGPVIKRVDQARQDGDTALAESVTIVRAAIDGEIETRAADVVRIDRAIVDQAYTQAQSLATVRAELQGGIDAERIGRVADVTRLDQARVDQGTAQAQALAIVKAELQGGIDGERGARLADVTRLDQARVDQGTVQAQALASVKAELQSGIDGEIAARESEIIRMDRAIAAGDSVQAQALATVRAELQGGIDGERGARLADVTRLDQARVDQGTVQAQALASVKAELQGDVAGERSSRAADVSRLDKAIVDQGLAQAQAVATVRADLGGTITAQVTRLDQAVIDERGARSAAITQTRAELDGKVAVAIDTATAAIDATGRISAVKTLAVDANGNIAGMRIIGSESGIGAIGLFNADLRMGFGRIICQSDTHMTVHGIGFGTTGQFLEWYGPIMSPEQCAEGNGIAWKRRDGKTYTRGALIAGVISNSVQTTSIAADASVATGQVGSNGGQRIVVVSYSLFIAQQHFDTSPSASGLARGVIVIRRNGQDVDTLIADGEWRRGQSFGEFEPGSYSVYIAAAKTFYDNTGGSSVSYSAHLVQRDPGPGVGATQGTFTQAISIVQSEG